MSKVSQMTYRRKSNSYNNISSQSKVESKSRTFLKLKPMVTPEQRKNIQKIIYDRNLITKILSGDYRYQPDEIFKRMKVSTFVQLILQVSEIDSLKNDVELTSNRSDMSKNASSLAYMGDTANRNAGNTSPSGTSRTEADRHSTLQEVIRGIGEFDNFAQPVVKPAESIKKLDQNENMPYLLLDIRDRDEYNACHIITALNYPAAMLSRSVNNETKELLAYKNQPGKIILIYDEDERVAVKAATTFVQRGYDNLFMLSGGLRLAVNKFPEGLITGTIPMSIVTANLKEQKASKRPSNIQPLSAYSSGPATKKDFDHNDVEKLNQYLEQILLPNDAVSRLSRNSNSSYISSSRSAAGSTMTNLSKATSLHSAPWKPI